MATDSGEPTRNPVIRVGPVSEEHWTVHVDDDPTPLSEHRTRADAESAARGHAEMFGYPQYILHALNGDQQTVIVDDPQPAAAVPGRGERRVGGLRRRRATRAARPAAAARAPSRR
jgi:hypothetical protein